MVKRSLSGGLLCMAVFVSSATVDTQTGATNGEWRSYGGDLGSTKYSPLDQIDTANFSGPPHRMALAVGGWIARSRPASRADPADIDPGTPGDAADDRGASSTSRLHCTRWPRLMPGPAETIWAYDPGGLPARPSPALFQVTRRGLLDPTARRRGSSGAQARGTCWRLMR